MATLAEIRLLQQKAAWFDDQGFHYDPALAVRLDVMYVQMTSAQAHEIAIDTRKRVEEGLGQVDPIPIEETADQIVRNATLRLEFLLNHPEVDLDDFFLNWEDYLNGAR